MVGTGAVVADGLVVGLGVTMAMVVAMVMFPAMVLAETTAMVMTVEVAVKDSMTTVMADTAPHMAIYGQYWTIYHWPLRQ